MTDQQTVLTEPRKPEERITANLTHENANAPKSRWWVWVLVAVVILGAVVIWQRRGTDTQAKAGGDPASRPVLVSTATAHQGDIGIYLNALGAV
ncbi:MAG: hypothetical protein WBP70_19895, partial [Terriglobales bacterium]